VDGLLKAKGRGRDMPPPVLVGTVRAAMALVMDLDDAGKDLIDEFWPGALTIVCRSSPTLVWDLGDTKGTVAVRMPLHQLALDLLKRTGPLAVSSANLSGRPPSASCGEAMDQLGDSVAVYLDGGPCPGDVPSTIVDLTGSVPRLLRQGVIPADRLREVILLNDLEETGPGDAAGDGTVTAGAGDPDGAAHGDAGEPDGVAADGVVSGGEDAGEPGGPGEATPGGATPGQEDAPDQGEPSRGPAAG
jgi:tRNA threonylcarbamoyl adenosine modification protein (Sua5/YciO/YrdC/YwlC family)